MGAGEIENGRVSPPCMGMDEGQPEQPAVIAWTKCPEVLGARASQVALVVKNPPANAGDIKDTSLILGSGRSPGGGHGNPLQYSCLENPMDRGA